MTVPRPLIAQCNLKLRDMHPGRQLVTPVSDNTADFAPRGNRSTRKSAALRHYWTGIPGTEIRNQRKQDRTIFDCQRNIHV